MFPMLMIILILLIARPAIITGHIFSQDLSEADWMVENNNQSLRLMAKIPGGIYTDLFKSGILLNDLYYKFNDVKLRWVAYENWTYYTTFAVESSMTENRNIFLIFHGLDTISRIYLNENFLGQTDNMFVRYTFDVASFIQVGNNTLRISFTSPVTYAKEKHDEFQQDYGYSIFPTCPSPFIHGECHANMIRKTQSSFGWDWGPAFPSVGIWKPVKLTSFNSAVIQEVQVFTFRGNDKPSWTVNLTVTLIMGPLQYTNGTFHVKLGTIENIFNASLSSDINGTTHHQITFDTQNMKMDLWWPNGFGNQSLYDVNVTFTNSAEETSSKIVQIGFRTVELVQDIIAPNVTGQSFYMKINDVPIFMKGSNWIPTDSFPERITEDYVRNLLQSAKDAHMNMLRVWGGGYYESDIFYETADRMGILIWQDMMFACSMYPATEQFLRSVETEITQQVERLQHHPSIALWCGNNENEQTLAKYIYNEFYYTRYKQDYIKLYVNTTMRILSKMDPTRPFLISSPTNGQKSIEDGYISQNPNDEIYGDVHFYDYFINGWDWEKYPSPRFASEYGFQSWPSLRTIANVSTVDDWNIFSRFSTTRQHAIFGNLLLMLEINRNLNLPTAFNSTIYLSQINQAMSVKTETEHYRRRKSETNGGKGWTMGALYWQLQDIWQAPSWSSIEYGGTWKMLHYYAVKFFSPLLVTCIEENTIIHIHVISDLLEAIYNITFVIDIRRWDQIGVSTFRTKGQIEILEPLKSSEIFQDGVHSIFQQANCPLQECFAIVSLTSKDGKTLAISDLYYPVPLRFISRLRKPILQITNVTLIPNPREDIAFTFEFTVLTDTVALFVWMEAGGIAGRFSDNGFHQIDLQKKLMFFAWQETTLESFVNSITITSLMNIY